MVSKEGEGIDAPNPIILLNICPKRANTKRTTTCANYEQQLRLRITTLETQLGCPRSHAPLETRLRAIALLLGLPAEDSPPTNLSNGFPIITLPSDVLSANLKRAGGRGLLGRGLLGRGQGDKGDKGALGYTGLMTND
jgi:hypothetical protein